MMYSGLPTSRLSTRGPHVKDCVRHVGGQDGRHGGRHGGGQGGRHLTIFKFFLTFWVRTDLLEHFCPARKKIHTTSPSPPESLSLSPMQKDISDILDTTFPCLSFLSHIHVFYSERP